MYSIYRFFHSYQEFGQLLFNFGTFSVLIFYEEVADFFVALLIILGRHIANRFYIFCSALIVSVVCTAEVCYF